MIVLAGVCSAFLRAEIKLSIRDMEGNRTKEGVMGVPFFVDVHMHINNGTMRYPTIDGLEHFAVQRSGFQLNTINGVSNATYSYQVRIDKPGTYVIGPATAKTAMGIEQSDTATITIVEQQEKKHAQNSTFLALSTNKQRLFVGEKVHCSLRFYYTNNGVQVRSISGMNERDIQGITMYQAVGPVQGQAEIQGVHYDYVEWSWDSVATQSGTIVIPAYAIEYHQEQPSHKNRFGVLFGIISHQVQQKKVYSNAVTLTVDDIPPTQETVHTVGIIQSFEARIHPSVVKQGEGMVLTLSVTGDIDMHSLDIHTLIDMPSACKWYESKQAITHDTKTFEFIVQGLVPGDWQIPPQKLHYFDTKAKKYKTIQSDILAVTVFPSAQENNKVVDEQEHHDLVHDTQTLLPLDTSDVWYEEKPCMLSWQWFIAFVAMMFVAWSCVIILYVLWNGCYKNNKVRVFARARQELKKAEEQGESSRVYAIMMHACADRMGMSRTEVTEHTIRELLIKAHYADETVHAWHLFFMQMQVHAFSEKKNINGIFEKAYQWLSILENVL